MTCPQSCIRHCIPVVIWSWFRHFATSTHQLWSHGRGDKIREQDWTSLDLQSNPNLKQGEVSSQPRITRSIAIIKTFSWGSKFETKSQIQQFIFLGTSLPLPFSSLKKLFHSLVFIFQYLYFKVLGRSTENSTVSFLCSLVSALTSKVGFWW